jgi:DNA-directed RNA polymerase specialized sigma24 family protein
VRAGLPGAEQEVHDVQAEAGLAGAGLPVEEAALSDATAQSEAEDRLIPQPLSPWQAVAALPTRARHILALRYLLDLPEAEIAVTLGIARGTVASTLSKSRKQLAAVLARPTPESSRPDSPDEARGETRR